jgi:hypothetical protein
MFIGNAQAGDWQSALCKTGSEHRISLYMDLLISKLIPPEDETDALAYAISTGDLPHRERDLLCALLARFHREGRRVFDGDAARAAFDALPSLVAIYRGTVAAEGNEYGVCWTLDRAKAHWFATKHGRFRNINSPAVILSATVRRDEICGVLWDRQEQEVLVAPALLREVVSTPA